MSSLKYLLPLVYIFQVLRFDWSQSEISYFQAGAPRPCFGAQCLLLSHTRLNIMYMSASFMLSTSQNGVVCANVRCFNFKSSGEASAATLAALFLNPPMMQGIVARLGSLAQRLRLNKTSGPTNIRVLIEFARFLLCKIPVSQNIVSRSINFIPTQRPVASIYVSFPLFHNSTI